MKRLFVLLLGLVLTVSASVGFASNVDTTKVADETIKVDSTIVDLVLEDTTQYDLVYDYSKDTTTHVVVNKNDYLVMTFEDNPWLVSYAETYTDTFKLVENSPAIFSLNRYNYLTTDTLKDNYSLKIRKKWIIRS